MHLWYQPCPPPPLLRERGLGSRSLSFCVLLISGSAPAQPCIALTTALSKHTLWMLSNAKLMRLPCTLD